MFDEVHFLSRVKGAGLTSEFGFEPVFLQEVDSTMNVPADFESAGRQVVPGLVVIAGAQTHGRGARGDWVSNTDDVMLTVVLPKSVPRPQFLGPCISLAVLAALNAAEVTAPLRVKWRNDVYAVTTSGPRKISGILVVSPYDLDCVRDLRARGCRISEDFTLVGVGVNMAPVTATGLRGNPISVAEISTGSIRREDLIARILLNFGILYQSVMRRAVLGPFFRAVSDHLWLGEDRRCEFEVLGGQGPVFGRFEGLTEDGIRFENGGERITLPCSSVRRIYPPGMRAMLGL
jgi:biotin-(acetyl-CoA carboxylase) ligase